MIQIQLIDGGYWPILTCAYCGRRVIHTGNVLWTVDPATTLPTGGPVLTHKYCHDLFTAQLPDASWMAVELLTFMIYLIYAGQIDLGT
jgi:hypothetical protein